MTVVLGSPKSLLPRFSTLAPARHGNTFNESGSSFIPGRLVRLLLASAALVQPADGSGKSGFYHAAAALLYAQRDSSLFPLFLLRSQFSAAGNFLGMPS